MKKTKKTQLHKPKFNTILLTIFILTCVLSISYAALKPFSSKEDTIFIKIKLSQGLWWNNSLKPPLWYAQAVKVGDYESDLLGNKTAEVINRRYYPADVKLSANQYETYLTLKLSAKKDSSTNNYRYKRTLLLVGTPVSFDLNSTLLTGVVMQIDKNEIKPNYQTKTLTLYNQYAYNADQLSEFNQIKVGDTYFDGTSNSVKIIDKKIIPRAVPFGFVLGKSNINPVSYNNTILLKVEVMVEEKEGKYIFGEEQQVVEGASLNLLTNTFDLSQFVIVSIE